MTKFKMIKDLLKEIKSQWKARRPNERGPKKNLPARTSSPAHTPETCLDRKAEHNSVVVRPPTYIPTGFPKQKSDDLIEHEPVTGEARPIMLSQLSSLIGRECRKGHTLSAHDLQDRRPIEDVLQQPDFDLPEDLPGVSKAWIQKHSGLFSQEGCRISSNGHGGEERLVIQLDRRLFLLLLDSVCHNRDLVQDMGGLAENMNDLEAKIEASASTATEADEVKIQNGPRIQHEAHTRTSQSLAEMTERLQQLEQLMSTRITEQYDRSYDMFDALDRMFVESEVLYPMPDYEELSGEDIETDQSRSLPAARSPTLQNEGSTGPMENIARSQTPHGGLEQQLLLHQEKHSDLRAVIREVADPMICAEAVDNGSRVAELLYDFNMSKAMFQAATCTFEQRHESFLAEAKERAHQAAQGGFVETQEVVDIEQLKATQRMTRDIVRTEAELEEAKAAIIAAGIQPPGSSVASGFVDDADDGYRISRETETDTFVEVPNVVKWLGLLPNELESPTSERDGLPQPEGDTEWEAKSVEIWESTSMVAEGSDKRRIYKWREMCGVLH